MRKQFNILFRYHQHINNLLIKLSEHELKNNKLLNKDEWNKILEKIIKYTDSKIYEILRKMYKQDNCFSNDRGTIMANKIINIIKSLNLQNINSLLDYGCANGTITLELAKQLNINNIYGADIKDLINPNFNFILLKNNNLMPTIKNKSIDFINASMVLHHVKDIDQTLKEFKRIISDKGIIVIREHDCRNKSFSTFLDILHGLYSLVWSEPIEDPTFINTYEAYYKSYEDWDKLFRSYGFQKIYFDNKKSIINAYYSIYTPIILEGSRKLNK
jgi:ubiquinone/menaquinone biosynthesis C-methylase UbiE